uniref:GST N-terminal domain-containing protein n=1 Tax=Craspedostauros australis TaxID=1486917 RepID=A0A6T6GUA9_9STRA|mmetsp:Transcript_3571/g.9458  ORF Transcript_3571/g.9458 Transcript_3571/m.9458 type:complete len:297 (+) Transcript_3571:84-974(+)
MKISTSSFVVLVASAAAGVNAWTPASTSKMTTAMSMSTDLSQAAFVKPERVVRDQLPTLYVYDHCPFCVRVRFALGMKNIKHNLYFLANDDIPTPTALVGKKISPIFQFPEDNMVMPESMDIVNFVDGDERFGPTGVIAPASGRTDLKDWQKSVQSLLRTLQRPRYVATGLLPEFQQLDGRHAFIKNHQLPPYDKAEWKTGDMTMEEKLKIYAEAMDSDPAPLLEELNAKLIQLDDKVACEYYCTVGGLSMDDVDLWARLRSITIVDGVEWPTKLRNYMNNLSELADIPLYDEMAM